MAETSRELVILHATDVHTAFDNISRLKSLLASSKQKLDVVLLSGDLANFPMEKMASASEADVTEQHQLLDKVVLEFVPLATKVFYIPGNHDVISTYRTGNESTHSPCNVHMRHVQVAHQLYLVGMGGSIPGYRNGTQCWDSFPYSDDSLFAMDLKHVFDPVFENDVSLEPADSVIVMTHNGPDQSSTTVARADPSNPIYSGSASLYSCLCKDSVQRHVVLNVHGHTHDAPGCSTIGQINVINPGALVEERFGIYTLTHQPKATPAWKVTSIQILRL